MLLRESFLLHDAAEHSIHKCHKRNWSQRHGNSSRGRPLISDGHINSNNESHNNDRAHLYGEGLRIPLVLNRKSPAGFRSGLMIDELCSNLSGESGPDGRLWMCIFGKLEQVQQVLAPEVPLVFAEFLSCQISILPPFKLPSCWLCIRRFRVGRLTLVWQLVSLHSLNKFCCME